MKKIAFITTIVVLILIIVGISRSIYELWRKQDLVAQYQKELTNAQKENQALKQKLSVVNNPNFVEEQARDNLFLVKPGEQSVIIPQELLTASNSAKPTEFVPNWKKWWSLFF